MHFGTDRPDHFDDAYRPGATLSRTSSNLRSVCRTEAAHCQSSARSDTPSLDISASICSSCHRRGRLQRLRDAFAWEIQVAMLTRWYHRNGRSFAWRCASASNYKKVIAEVLLQRTRAETIAAFFGEFVSEYPSWKQLAAARETDLQEFLRGTLDHVNSSTFATIRTYKSLRNEL